jgi:hypothetical protein
MSLAVAIGMIDLAGFRAFAGPGLEPLNALSVKIFRRSGGATRAFSAAVFRSRSMDVEGPAWPDS